MEPTEEWSHWKIRQARHISDRPEAWLLRGQFAWVGDIRRLFPSAHLGNLMLDTITTWDLLPAEDRTQLPREAPPPPEVRAWVLARCEEYQQNAREGNGIFPVNVVGHRTLAEARSLFPDYDAVGLLFRCALYGLNE